MLNRVMTRDNIALVATLKIKDKFYPRGRRVNIIRPDSVKLSIVFSYLTISYCVYMSFSLNSCISSIGVAPGSKSNNNAPLVVCTAHIHWDPEFCDVKLIQSMMLVQELSLIVDQTSQDWNIIPSAVPIISCGDLNSLPESGKL